MLPAKMAVASAAGRLSRLSRRGGGTSFPGKLLLRLAPDALSRLGRQLPRGSVIVSATNGKTTTAGMIASVLERAGIEPAHNRAGANMPGGVATALLEKSRHGRIRSAQLGLFEADEAWLEALVTALAPHTLVLGNLFRDQLDRYGELERLADGWAALIASPVRPRMLVLNADDPLVADLGRDASGQPRDGTLYFGVEDRSHALPSLEHAFDAKHCRRCGTAYHYSAAYLGHLGDYACPGCGNNRPPPDVAARHVELDGMSGSSVSIDTPAGPIELSLRLPGLYNVYNALAAVTCCLSLGIDTDRVKHGLESFAAAFGRAEQIQIDSHVLSILLIKNPVGANEVFRTLVSERRRRNSDMNGLDLFMALNDKIADGRDVSWVWDADFELLAPETRRVVCSGTRASELALRLKYAGVDENRLAVEESLDVGLDRALSEADGTLYALPTYTALIELRDLLSERGHARRYWEAS
jgi:lipid II isoglutaminyl synthase (glutamine-hydrolysing)